VTVIDSALSEAPEKKTRSTMLPLLTVLFVISYALLTLLVVEQGRTIESQRSLLRELMKDSTQLAALKGKMARERASDKAQEKPSPRTGRQDPATGNSDSGAAGAAPNGSSKGTRQPGKSRTMKDVPQKPAADLQDVRRSTRVI
jgi:hypothetical protein